MLLLGVGMLAVLLVVGRLRWRLLLLLLLLLMLLLLLLLL
jgi:hypothetical protein